MRILIIFFFQDDDHDAEEWERYEALHEDVTKQACYNVLHCNIKS